MQNSKKDRQIDRERKRENRFLDFSRGEGDNRDKEEEGGDRIGKNGRF